MISGNLDFVRSVSEARGAELIATFLHQPAPEPEPADESEATMDELADAVETDVGGACGEDPASQIEGALASEKCDKPGTVFSVTVGAFPSSYDAGVAAAEISRGIRLAAWSTKCSWARTG
ncbi:hypothetical protein ACX8Z9_08175 [Arthrobacter halodurans]|uniref:Uncharacterized protein n=1 Tax=Arthrobacter halodurans TaxID=516699 RepID=A0ABV4UJJ6_9MICC